MRVRNSFRHESIDKEDVALNPTTIAFAPEVPSYLGACPYSMDCVKILDSDGGVQSVNTDGLLLMEIDDFCQ